VPYSCAALKASGGDSAYRWTIATKALPAGLALDPTTGAITGTPSKPGTFDFGIRVSDGRGQSADFNPLTIVIEPAKIKEPDVISAPTGTPPPPPAPRIDTLSLPEGKVGVAYSVTLDASAGTPPYRWSVDRLPAGLSLNGPVIRGRPTAEGTSEVQLHVTDRAKQTADRALTISIKSVAAPPSPLKILTTALPDGRVGTALNASLTGTGGVQPYRWASTGQVPRGLQLDASGALHGTPAAEGRFTLSVRLSDKENHNVDGSISLVIAPAAVVPDPGTKKGITAQTLCPAGTPTSREDANLDSATMTGSLEWTGPNVTGPAGVIVIVGKQKRQGPGGVSPQSKALTGAPIDFATPNGVQVLEPPSVQNGWRCIAFQPNANSVKIDWKVNWALSR
jgi:hypothetical protein